MNQKTRMPVLFVGHGSPLNAIEETKDSRGWESLAKKIPTPKAIVAISAHFYVPGTWINDSEQPHQIYDMYGFPQELYDLTYQPKGDKALAHEIVDLLGEAKPTKEWGIDHGVWSVLHWMYPQANIPVVEMSVDRRLSPQEKVALGTKLKSLRDEGVLILASGNVVHNLYEVDWDQKGGFPWAERFSSYITNCVKDGRFAEIIDYLKQGKDAELSVPTPDHFDPLFYVLGAVEPHEKVEIVNDHCTLGSISMVSYLIG
jgi:4,5-DOPA dioxygenase extradiol